MSGGVPRASATPRIPAAVWALGLVSLCMDLSSELIHSILPLFLALELGASALAIGVIEGVAEALALIVKMFSGVLSDRFGRRKPLVLIGYGLAALTKVVFPLAPSLGWVVGARFVDRIGKGIRGAPRDALIADIAPAEVRGASFGLRQALDTVGACAGPLLAIAAMTAFAGSFRATFWIAVIPAIGAMLLLVFAVREPPDRARQRAAARPPINLRAWTRLGRRFHVVTGIAAILTLARFSEAFLVLRAQNVGLAPAQAPWVMVAMTFVYAAVAYPAGRAADRGHAMALLHGGLLALIAADLVLAIAREPWTVHAGSALWGLHMGLTQGLLAAFVAASAPSDLRGTAFGVFNLVSGVALLAASTFAGWLWQAHGPGTTFYAGAILTAIAWLLLLAFGGRTGLRGSGLGR